MRPDEFGIPVDRFVDIADDHARSGQLGIYLGQDGRAILLDEDGTVIEARVDCLLEGGREVGA